MSQEVKIIVGILAGIMLVLIVSVVVWTAATVNQLTKDKDRLDQTTQKLADSASETTVKVKALEAKDFDVAKDIKNVRKDVDTLNTEVGELITATGRQLKDIKGVIVEQSLQLDGRISDIEQKNAEYSGKIEELNRRLPSQKTSVAPAQPANKPSGRVFVDVNNSQGPVGWDEQYKVQLHAVVADEQNFRIDWTNPEMADDISETKPDIVKKTPKFKNARQLYFFLKLGDAADNRIAGVMDFVPTDEKYFLFDLYLDKDHDGDLAEDFVPVDSSDNDSHNVRGIKVSYKDGTTEEYSLEIYAVQDKGKITVWYAPGAGRYGVLEADKKKISILVLDDSGNGLFNDSDDVILLDMDLDGQIDVGHQDDADRKLYSILELPGGKYRVTEIDAAGRRLTLGRIH